MIRIRVDLTNPGAFFGCCGLFELAHRLWPDTTCRFEDGECVLSQGDLHELVQEAARAPLIVLVKGDRAASPMLLDRPFELRIDWWKAGSGDPSLKSWAGRMLASRIALAMQRELPDTLENGFFDDGHVVIGPDGNKVEPFYFDARRGASALPLDVGFSSDALGLETVAFPATEFFTLIGLQRFRPASTRTARVFRYRAWRAELPIRLAALAAGDALPDDGPLLHFENAFRTDQRKHKAFTPAIPVSGAGNERTQD